MKIIDISWPISDDMTEYKNQRTVHFDPIKTFERDRVRQTIVSMSTHTGTHVDAPSHFIRDGVSVDQIPLDHFFGECTVLDLTGCVDRISAHDLEVHNIKKSAIILLKTKNSALGSRQIFTRQFVYLDKTGAEYLRQKCIKTVGIDYLGIEHSQPEHETHQILLSNSIGIIEGVRLNKVEPGTYVISCFPLLVTGADAAPARAVLIKE